MTLIPADEGNNFFIPSAPSKTVGLQQAKPDTQSFTGFMGEVLGAVADPFYFANKARDGGAQRLLDTMGAAYGLENDVVNGVELALAPTFVPTPGYSPIEQLKADGIFETLGDKFVGVRSQAEYDYKLRKIQTELQRRETLSQAGFGGLVASVTAGLLSPTVLLPFIGEARGLTAAVRGFGLGALGGAAQELPLQLNQETRTITESVVATATAGFFGGGLGAAVGFLRKPLAEVSSDFSGAMKAEAVQGPTHPPSLNPKAAGADVNERLPLSSEVPDFAGPLRDDGSIIDKTLAAPLYVSPVVQTGKSIYGQARKMMAGLSNAGLEYVQTQDGKVVARGGTVENRIETYFGKVSDTFEQMDKAYARYMLGKTEVANLDYVKARFSKLAKTAAASDKISYEDFKKQISVAMTNNDVHVIPEVSKMAAAFRREIYDPLLKKMEDQGMLKGLSSGELGDLSYLNRVYDINMIEKYKSEFTDIIQNHYAESLLERFNKDLTRYLKKSGHLKDEATDLSLPPVEIAKAREQFLKELSDMQGDKNASIKAVEAELTHQRSIRRDKTNPDQAMQDAAEKIKALEEKHGPSLVARRTQRADIRRRLRNLNRAVNSLAGKKAELLNRVSKAEDLTYSNLVRLSRAGQRFLNKLDTMSDAAFDAALRKLDKQFEAMAVRYDKLEGRINKLSADETSVGSGDKLFKVEVAQEKLTDDMLRIFDKVHSAETVNRAEARQMVEEALADATKRTQAVITKRTLRTANILGKAEKLDPAIAQSRVTKILGGIAEDGGKVPSELSDLEVKFREKWREYGADEVDLKVGGADFAAKAKEMARQTVAKIVGESVRLPGMDIILTPNGAELARTLNLPSSKLVNSFGDSFLNQDITQLAVRYTKTLAPDVELNRVLGDFAPDRGLNIEFRKLSEEVDAIKALAFERMKAGLEPMTGEKAAKPFTKLDIEKVQGDLSKKFARDMKNLSGTIDRLRFKHGIPSDPTSFINRAGTIARQANVLRFMNKVVVASVPDIARPIMTYGALKTFRNGWVPFVKGLGKLELSKRHLRIAGAATDLNMHQRSSKLYGFDDYQIDGSKFENGLSWLTAKQGLVAGFDYWTTAMKQIAGSTAMAEMTDSISMIMGATAGTAKEQKAASSFLARMGIDSDLAERVWKSLNAEGGADKIDGILWPNTANWADGEAAIAMEQALVNEVNRVIITPGVELPFFVDSSLAGKMIWQFKSFGLSSVTKTYGAGLQAKDGNMVLGSLISLALGATSYYISAQLAGGRSKTRADTALAEGDWRKFTDEAIDKSGLLGIGADVKALMAGLPGIGTYTSFSEEPLYRRSGAGLRDTLLGPTFGSMLKTTTDLATGNNVVGNIFELAPYQNHPFAFQQLYQKIEDATNAQLGGGK